MGIIEKIQQDLYEKPIQIFDVCPDTVKTDMSEGLWEEYPKLQAQEEVLAIFDYSRANVPESELLDISQGGAANAKLLAMSAIIQGDLTVGQMSQLLANISTDIASDGTLDDTNLRNTLIENSKNKKC